MGTSARAANRGLAPLAAEEEKNAALNRGLAPLCGSQEGERFGLLVFHLLLFLFLSGCVSVSP